MCWGRNLYGRLGNGSPIDSTTPVAVTGLTDAVALDASGAHSCALKRNGTVVCWGLNFYGQIGDGTTTDRNVPTAVSGLTGIVALNATGSFHTCALKSDGRVYCWGFNQSNGLGDGTTIDRSAPVLVTVAGVTGIVAIAAHHRQTNCAVKADGTQVCWGTTASS